MKITILKSDLQKIINSTFKQGANVGQVIEQLKRLFKNDLIIVID
jgi:hypothetical protein